MTIELRDFLTSRRAALSPEDVGLPAATTPRKVKGLRRAEVAILAGVSVDYYVKLEQGRARNVSEQVVEAVARALRLDDVESRYFSSLLQPGTRHQSTARARPAVQSMIRAIDVPAVIHGPHLEVLGINHAGKALLDDFEAMPPEGRNLAKWMFLNPRARIVYRDWAEIASDIVATLRASIVPGRGNEAVARIVGDLSTRSEEFASMWADYRLSEHQHGVKRFFHEAVGDMKLNWQTLQLPDAEGQTVVIYSADTGSPSEEKLRLLSSWTTKDAGGRESDHPRTVTPPR
ncbi:helix-turn-helix transcriptional regulator [Lentzea sp. NBRC 102530]|uniref:helix-turn-helix transcriptional regulator n=1 Tax=Lentzea sp. NBRC 102530 TaxID=3032201 RepID=UPI0024A49616|nr:helix-turn-helix transcriptional regulator [Lentzea sp. NBRC 102530]GLY52777.1 transcriptional regulator [Lentzea sp. NBRC 102530]